MSKNCTLVPFDAAEGLTLQQAAAVAGKSQRTLRNWRIEHGIGRRVADGTWVVSRVALAMLLHGDLDALASRGNSVCAPALSPYASITNGSI